ncbi:glycoside hydrolase [Cerioporus squamosus]|nr:glycoside hydrolase [Cerioporus squamosus]
MMLLPLSLLAALPFSWAVPMCSLKPASAIATSSAPAPSGTAVGGAATSGSGKNSTLGDQVVATTWYAGWHGTDFPPEKLSWSKYSSVTYAFAVTTPDVNTVSLEASDEELLPRFVDLAHQNGVKALLTIGGWTGSQYFSSAVATEQNRTAFVETVMNLVNQYQLDGVDFDWEYPNKQGMGCNVIAADDSQNFLSFLQALRATAGQNLTISAAAGITPFAGPDGTPMADVSAFADALDYVAIMNYDVWGSWSNTVGPNAPLNDTCASDQEGSALVLGVASYGHSFKVSQSDAVSGSELAAYPAFDKTTQPLGDSWDEVAPAGVDQCGNPTAGGASGIFDFWGLIEGGFLTQNGTAADGIEYRFDECSQTPYVYKADTQVMVSYDDTRSFAAKGQFINDAGLLGFAMWEAAGDSNDMLLDAISQAIGIEEVGC